MPATAALLVVVATAVLVARRQGQGLDAVLLGGAVAVVPIAAVCFLLVRRRFESVADAYVRIEAREMLHNGLTLAAEGRQAWPAVGDAVPHGLRWQWRRLLHPGLAAGLVAAATLVPIQPVAQASVDPVEEPLAWREMEQWLDALEEEEIIEPEPLTELREQIRQLRAQPAEDWYSHSSLEAGDSLREQTANSINDLADHLEAARAAVAALQEQGGEELTLAGNEAWNSLMDQVLEGLRDGKLPIDPSLLAQLENIDPSNLRRLTDEEWEALMKALENGAKACRGCTGDCDGTNLVAVVAMCQAWGRGGIDRGPGEAPLFLSENETDLGTTTVETLPAGGLERAALGDTLAVGEGEHEIDETAYRGPAAAGEAGHRGEGGDTVWKQPLTPDEQAVLEEYFQ